MTQAKKKKITETEVSFQSRKPCYCLIDTTKRVGVGVGGEEEEGGFRKDTTIALFFQKS